VRRQDAAQWAPKQTFGDYTKDSEKLSSAVVWSDQRGGLGIRDMDEVKDMDRSEWSELETNFRGHLVNGPLWTAETNGGANAPTISIEYANEQYVVFGTAVYKHAGTDSWTDLSHTLGASPTDAIVHKGKLYFACGTDFERFDGTTWTTGTALSGSARACRWFCEWDDKLFWISNAGQLSYSVDEGVSVDDNALSSLPTGSFNGLITYRNSSGDIVIYLGTTVGLYELDYNNSKWLDTEARFTEHPDGCKGLCVYPMTGALYYSVGNAVFEYKMGGGEAVITPMGLSVDYGIPSTRFGSAYVKGSIFKLLSDHNYLYAFITPDTGYYGCILKWNGKGWSNVIVWGGGVSDALSAPSITTAGGNYRMWCAFATVPSAMYWMPLSINLVNTLENADLTYSSQSQYHFWPWFDANNPAIDKLALEVTVYVVAPSGTNIRLYYRTNYSTAAGTLIKNSTFTDGVIDTTGETTFYLPAVTATTTPVGVAFKAIQIYGVWGANGAVSADLRWLRLTYQKLLTPQYRYDLILDCSHDYRHKRAKTLEAGLVTAYETDTLGEFIFRTALGTAETHQVKVMQMQELTQAGRRQAGQYKVQLVEL